jgi:uncharacterized YigZ family protein
MDFFSYTTIGGPSEGLYRDKGSKFLAFAYPVESEDAIRGQLEWLRRKYFDARHHCFAWMLGADKKLFRAFDDGEPNHSAGDPILGQIRSRDVTNVLVVVVRYFGGVKLGVGGLVTAYRTAAEEALRKATLVEVEVKFTLSIDFPYVSTPEVMKLIKDFNLDVLHQEFLASCRMELRAPLRDKQKLLDKASLLKALGSDLLLTVAD